MQWWCLPHGRYGSYCRSCSIRSSSKSSSSCTCDNNNNPQDHFVVLVVDLILTDDEDIARESILRFSLVCKVDHWNTLLQLRLLLLKKHLILPLRNMVKMLSRMCVAMADVFNQHPDFQNISGGTNNHLFLVDVTKVVENGKVAQNVLEEVNITLNKNGIPLTNNCLHSRHLVSVLVVQPLQVVVWVKLRAVKLLN